MNAPQFSYKIIYQQKNITRDISDYLLSLSYTDKVAGETDELTLELHDKEKLWQNDWYPLKKSTFSIQIFDDIRVLDCGTFVVDENKFSSSRSGDKFTIGALAASVGKALRTKRSATHESKTLKEIAATVASRHGLTIVGKIDNVSIGRVTQYRKSDLEFLRHLSSEYGYIFSVRDKQLVFTSVYDLEKRPHSLTLDKTDVAQFDFTDTTQGTVQKAKVKHHNSATNEVVDYEATEEGEDRDPAEDEATDNSYVENKQQAELKGKAKLHKANEKEQTASISCKGHVLIVSGNTIELTGFGRFSGIYLITEAAHNLSRGSGWTTSFEARKVNTIAKKKHYAKIDDNVDTSDSLERAKVSYG